MVVRHWTADDIRPMAGILPDVWLGGRLSDATVSRETHIPILWHAPIAGGVVKT